jgi:hypothetical protein
MLLLRNKQSLFLSFFLSIVEAHSGFFTADAQYRGISIGVPGRNSNPGLPYSKPTAFIPLCRRYRLCLCKLRREGIYKEDGYERGYLITFKVF